jgi:hypothetical protein
VIAYVNSACKGRGWGFMNKTLEDGAVNFKYNTFSSGSLKITNCFGEISTVNGGLGYFGQTDVTGRFY